MGYQTWDLVPKPLKTNIVGSRWTFHVKCDNLGNINKFKARVIAQGFSLKFLVSISLKLILQ